MNFNFRNHKYYRFQWQRLRLLIIAGVCLAVILSGCSTVTTNQYEAAARTTYTWLVHYYANGTRKEDRIESFSSTSLLNRNGQKPEGAVTGPDDQGLWWPALPARPTLDEIEQRQQPYERANTPELWQNVDYRLTYRAGERTVTLPTNYDVYREVAKAYPFRPPLHLTLGINNFSVEKAEP